MISMGSVLPKEESEAKASNNSESGPAHEVDVKRGHRVFSTSIASSLDIGEDGDGDASFENDVKLLLGNLEKFPKSARKLFAMGKIYLTGKFKAEDDDENKGFVSFFQPLHKVQDQDDVSSENQPSLGQAGQHGSDGKDVVTEKKPDPEFKQTFPGSASHGCGSNLFVPLRQSAPLYKKVQTYVQWRAIHDLNSMYLMCMRPRNIIYIQPLDTFPEFVSSFCLNTTHLQLDYFQTLQAFAQIFFSGFEVLIRAPLSVSDSGYSVTSRMHPVTHAKQYRVNDLYPLLQNSLPSDGLCVLGVVWTDIYPEGFNFVLGEASSTHKAAVLSFGRFESKGFNAATHKDVEKIDGNLLWKLFKSTSHELCHVLGFHHCHFFHCAMNESSSVDEAMSQPLFLCPVCLRKLQKACGFDVLERYKLLRQFLHNVNTQFADCQRIQDSMQWLESCIDYLSS